MIIAIERYKFIYLYKFGTIPVDLSAVCWHEVEELIDIQQQSPLKALALLDSSIPPFEDDHEVILLDYEPTQLSKDLYKHLSFEGVRALIPITERGRRFLQNKLNADFKLQPASFDRTVGQLIKMRETRMRSLASRRLAQYFELTEPAQAIQSAIIQSLENIENAALGSNRNVFSNLVNYNTTERFLPDGNAEHLCRVLVLALIQSGTNKEVIRETELYKGIISLKREFEGKGYTDTLSYFLMSIDATLQERVNKIKSMLAFEEKLDMFVVSYLFFAFRKALNDNTYDLKAIALEVEKASVLYPRETSTVIYALGAVFSFNQLYESIYRLENAPLFVREEGKAMRQLTEPNANPEIAQENNSKDTIEQKNQTPVNTENDFKQTPDSFEVEASNTNAVQIENVPSNPEKLDAQSGSGKVASNENFSSYNEDQSQYESAFSNTENEPDEYLKSDAEIDGVDEDSESRFASVKVIQENYAGSEEARIKIAELNFTKKTTETLVRQFQSINNDIPQFLNWIKGLIKQDNSSNDKKRLGSNDLKKLAILRDELETR